MKSLTNLHAIFSGAFLLPVLLAQTGCLSNRSHMAQLRADNAAGTFEAGVVHSRDWVGIKANQELDDQTRLGASGLLAAMEYGHMQLNACKYQEAQNTFDWTQRKWSDLWNNPSRDEGVAGAGARKVAQITSSPYSAYAHEGMMLYSYLGLSDWLVGDKDAARGHFASALEPRQQANTRIDEQVAKQEEAYRDKTKEAERKALQEEAAKVPEKAADGGIGSLISQLREKVDASMADSVAQQQNGYGWATEGAEPSELEKYRNYENPLLSYLYFLTLAVHGSGETDYNDARNEANRLAVMIADRNKTVSGDIAKLGLSTERNWPLDLGKGVYVFFETGMAPRWSEKKISIPIPSVYLSYVGIALPELIQNQDCVPALSVADAADGGSEKLTAPLLNMDVLVVQDFKNRYKGIVAGEVADAVILAIQNATINYLAKILADQSNNKTHQMLIRVGGAVAAGGASAARTSCDTRSWEILPKFVQVTRVDRPADGRLKLAYSSGGWSGTVPLIEGDLTVVWVKSTSATQINPAIHQFRLK